MKRNYKEDNQKDTSQMTMVIVKLETISNGIIEIKTEINNMKSEMKELRDKVIVNEQSLKSAWKQIDELKAKERVENED
jgi:cell division protein FtsL